MNITTSPSWQLAGATRDTQSITTDWMPLRSPAIHDVRVLESRWVNKANGRLAEIYRQDWTDADLEIGQVFQVVLNGGGLSAWHVHEQATDRLSVIAGQARLVLYDARSQSPTYKAIYELLLSAYRPQLVIVPPGIWHGVENVDHTPAVILNMPDRAYAYEQPDHWRLPPTTTEIPYRFGRAASGFQAI